MSLNRSAVWFTNTVLFSLFLILLFCQLFLQVLCYCWCFFWLCFFFSLLYFIFNYFDAWFVLLTDFFFFLFLFLSTCLAQIFATLSLVFFLDVVVKISAGASVFEVINCAHLNSVLRILNVWLLAKPGHVSATVAGTIRSLLGIAVWRSGFHPATAGHKSFYFTHIYLIRCWIGLLMGTMVLHEVSISV